MRHPASVTEGGSEPSAWVTRRLLGLLSIYVGLILYASLIPFRFDLLPLGQAWEAFLASPDMRSPYGTREDWTTNLFLSLPVGLLGAAALCRRWRFGPGTAIRWTGVLLLCLALPPLVELLQVLVPGRIPSRNDIVAQWTGGLIGAGLWAVGGRWLAERLKAGREGVRSILDLLGWAYLIGYLGLVLFPFDFTFRPGAIGDRLAEGNLLPLVAGSSCRSGCLGHLLLEAGATVPLGAVLARYRPPQAGWAGWIFGALGFGALVEAAQLLLAGGVAQAVSAVARAAGVLGGLVVGRTDLSRWHGILLRHGRHLVLGAAPVYLLVVGLIAGWFQEPLRGLDEIRQTLHNLHWLPLYYHFYTGQSAALYSLVAQTVLYVPIGLACWLWGWAGRRPLPPGVAVGWAFGLALVAEMGKLLFRGLRPDPTDVFVAVTAAWVAWHVARLLHRGRRRDLLRRADAFSAAQEIREQAKPWAFPPPPS